MCSADGVLSAEFTKADYYARIVALRRFLVHVINMHLWYYALSVQVKIPFSDVMNCEVLPHPNGFVTRVRMRIHDDFVEILVFELRYLYLAILKTRYNLFSKRKTLHKNCFTKSALQTFVLAVIVTAVLILTYTPIPVIYKFKSIAVVNVSIIVMQKIRCKIIGNRGHVVAEYNESERVEEDSGSEAAKIYEVMSEVAHSKEKLLCKPCIAVNIHSPSVPFVFSCGS